MFKNVSCALGKYLESMKLSAFGTSQVNLMSIAAHARMLSQKGIAA